MTENENINSTLKDKEIPQEGTWIKWGTGYFYTTHKDLVMEHLSNIIKSEDNKPLSLSDMISKDQSNKGSNNSNNVHQIDINKLSAKTYSNHCITDAYGDRYFDIPIYLLNQVTDNVNDYFQVEARKLSFKKRIRLVRLLSNLDCFDIEQILFQNKPTNSKIIPTLEKATECSEYSQIENLENCLSLAWKCVACNVKSDHWTKLNKHNCIEDESTLLKPKKNSDGKTNSRGVSAVRLQHICPHCNGEFDSEGYLRTHLMVHINDSNKCPFCDQPIAPEMMETHLIAHQNPEFSNLKFLCKYELILLLTQWLTKLLMQTILVYVINVTIPSFVFVVIREHMK